MPKIALRIVFGLLIAFCSIVFLEFVLQEFVTYALGQGRLFSQDPVVGWTVRKNLNVARRNPAGKQWDVKTGECGYRGRCDWSSEAVRRLLVLGDSFAFGEGVTMEERFDSHLTRAFPRWSIVNLGVMGYGTDQEILVSRPFVSRMMRRDIVLLIIYGNDFFD